MHPAICLFTRTQHPRVLQSCLPVSKRRPHRCSHSQCDIIILFLTSSSFLWLTSTTIKGIWRRPPLAMTDGYVASQPCSYSCSSQIRWQSIVGFYKNLKEVSHHYDVFWALKHFCSCSLSVNCLSLSCLIYCKQSSKLKTNTTKQKQKYPLQRGIQFCDHYLK